MNGNRASALLIGLAGLVLGGTLVQVWNRVAQVLISMGTVGGFLGGATGAMLSKDVTKAAAVGSGIGVAAGTMLLLIDALIQG